MRKLTLLVVLCVSFVYGQNAVAQNKDFLRNYEAPDFKQRRLDVRFNSSGVSGGQFGSNGGVINGEAGLGYRQFANSQKYQGNLDAGFITSLHWDKNSLYESLDVGLVLRVSSENRFYFKPNWFVGVHGTAILDYSFYSQTGIIGVHSGGDAVAPIVSVGRGRLEPVHYARNAMDIERQLKRGGRLTKDYSTEELTTIADKIAEINNVRFYDFRFRRIEQFEELDKTMNEIGGVSEYDMTYFAHLADAYLFANRFRRFSGFRQEIGVLPTAGFYKMNYHLPQNYMIQHHVNASLMGGIASELINISDVDPKGVWAIGGYELGLFPNTRTNINFGTQVGYSSANESYGGQIYSNGAVWLSPEFRLFFNASLSVGDGNVTTDLDPFLYQKEVSSDGYRINGSIGITYAIF